MIKGSCLCGGVVFAISGPVTAIQLCHCSRCRKASGAAHSSELLVANRNFSWLKGEELIAIYEAPLLHTPPVYRRAFCQCCGSPLPVKIDTESVILHAGILDDDPGTKPKHHTFVAKKAPWYKISDDLPQYLGAAPKGL